MKISEARFAGSSTRVERKPGTKLPEFAFIGRSNVGKSSLINSICRNGKLALTSSTPGKTKVVNHFLINGSWYLVDLPGYGYAKTGKKGQEEIADVINDYILNSEELAMLFVLIDSRHDIGAIDSGFLEELGEHGIPFCIVYTKCDKQGPNVLKEQMRRNEELLLQKWESLPEVFCTSSLDGRGREDILTYIENVLKIL